MTTILFVGGGSIGHIAPGIAVANELKKIQSDIIVHFVCSANGTDGEFLQKEGLIFSPVDASRLSWSFPWKFTRSFMQARKILSVHKPNLIFSKGGYVSVPLCIAAIFRRIPFILHESDVVTGYANYFFRMFAMTTCSGNPIRPMITCGSRQEGLRITGFSGQKPVLLVIGGSQGSQALNEVIWKQLETLLDIVDIAHIVGHGKYQHSTFNIQHSHRYWSIAFAYDELPHIYALANIALSRAGANVIAELKANHIPTILVPLRGVAHDHQNANVIDAIRSSLFIKIEQSDLQEHLIPTIQSILQKKEKTKQANHLQNPARHIAQIILNSLEPDRKNP